MNQVIPSMLRRLRNWDYRGRAIYMITVVLADRRRHLLGEVVDGKMVPSAMGKAVEDCWNGIPRFYPQIQMLASQVMPEHFHGVPYVRERLKCHLSHVIGGFKVGCNRAYAQLYPNHPLPPGTGIFAKGFQDTVLLHAGQLQKMIDYIHDNPRRLWEKRQHKEYFTVLRDVEIPGVGPMQAVGNLSLLQRPVHVQVQVSRSSFRYQRDARGNPMRDASPAFMTEDFTDLQASLLDAAQHGAVLVSPCLSDGEKAIARATFQAGYPLIVLRNQGFGSFYKPEGEYFDACAEGRLLQLSPATWHPTTQKHALTREEAWVLNRICQLLSGDGAAVIQYHGSTPEDVDLLVAKATGRR